MKSQLPNQFSGRNAPGFRFPFRVRSIAHRSLFLPIVMQNLPQIHAILSGESPLSVFNCCSIHEARRKFCDLRKKYDFAYWAITEYYIPDIKDADNIVPLRLNEQQHYITDIMLKLYDYRLPERYIITKSTPRCGLTTCVQAYIFWMQHFQRSNNSYTCSSSEINLLPLKTNLCRMLHRDIVPPEKWIYLPKVDWRAFFNTYHSPDMIRGINLGFVHFADMSKWKDPRGHLTSRTLTAAVGAVLRAHFTLVVYEGNLPGEERFPYRKIPYTDLPLDEKMARFRHLSNNPYLLNHVLHVATLPGGTGIIHINLDHMHDNNRRISVPFRPSAFPI